jgi:hypothetical protein
MDYSYNPYAGLATPQASLGFPAELTFEAAWPMIEALSPSEVLLGVDGDAGPLTVDLASEAPHILVNAGTGGGKTVTARGIAAQIMARGGSATFLDIKMHSHRWAKGLDPLAWYASAPTEIGRGLVSVGRELHRRNAAVERGQDPGPIHVVVFEEMNATMRVLADLDKRVPKGEYRAVDAFRDIMFMGRAVRIHVVATAQLASYRDSGGPEIIENFGARVLARYSPQAWKWLGVGLPLAAPSQLGRAMLCYGSRAREGQLLNASEEECFRYVVHAEAAYQRARQLNQAIRMPLPWRTARRSVA